MKRRLLTFCLISFSYLIYAQPSNDNRANAILLSDLSSWSSVDGAYTNTGATSDGPSAGDTFQNVWFKFQATTTAVDVKVLVQDSKGTLPTVNIKLYDSQLNLLSQGKVSYPTASYHIYGIQNLTLVPGDVYYISIDGNTAGQHGTFSLRISDAVGNDVREKATTLSNIHNWSSPNGAFNNVDAMGTGFNNEPWAGQHNVWFKFKATTSEVDIKVLSGGTKGTIASPFIKLFTSTGQELVYTGANYQGPQNVILILQSISLTPGADYYFAVDSRIEIMGSFSLQVNDAVGNDMRDRATALSNIHAWSSQDAEYDNSEATGNGFDNSPWAGYQNIWFKFQATSTEIDIRTIVGSTKGTLANGVVKLFTNSGQLIATSRPGWNDSYKMVLIQLNTLTPGATYYFSVDHNAGLGGTFSLQVNDAYGNDDKTKAIELQHLSSWCSSNQQYSNAGASPDANVAGGNICVNFMANVWFKFKALSSKVVVKVQTGGNQGTIKSPTLVMVDENNMAINCTYGAGSLTLQNDNLKKDSWYYISVDNNGLENMGTFTLCIEGGPEASALCDNIYCDANGGVGIGTPKVPVGYRMSVNGKIITEGVKVQLQSQWPDYVFSPSYDLQQLDGVRRFIEKNGHLPKMPPANTVQQDGLDLEKINVILVEKIEELTLYLIQLEERLKKLEAESKP